MTPVHQKSDCSRRSFLKYSSLLGLGTAAGALFPVKQAEAILFNREQYKVSEMRLAMGTFVAMTAIHPSRDQAQEAFGRAFTEVDRLTRLLSRYNQDSPVTELNTTGQVRHAPPELLQVIGRALFYHRQTAGMFDITVKPLVDLYQSCSTGQRRPSESELDEALAKTGSDALICDQRSVRFAKRDMGITLDGIAKGYIVDRVSELLHREGVVNHLINAGGDIRTCGTADHGKKWSIGVQDPDKQRDYPAIIGMGSGAIATSGNYEVYYDQEKLFHHIVNSRSGLSPQLSSSVSVLAPTVVEADALSTAVFVFEPEAGIAFINSQPDCECLIVQRHGDVRTSSGWAS